ncbi:MAG: SDR family oxidoreductase [Lactobacillus sp.]|nr:SDR family oxidoreductase [Lactobacillus sp.]
MVVGRLIKRMVPGFLKQKIKTYLKLYCGDNSPKYVKYDLNIQNVGRAKDKVILVTGGTGAIGSAVCLRMALEGAIVGLCGRTEMKIEKTIEQIKQCYPEAKLVPVVLDVTNEHNIEDAISKFAQQNGKLDILINNAGGGARNSALSLRMQDVKVIDGVLNTNLRGSLLCAKYASAIMVGQREGKIISMSSVMGINGKENWSEYSSSKAGILGLTKSLALELGEYNITVNAISPGMVQQIPFDRAVPKRFSHTNALRRYGYTDEVASMVAFLCSDEANYITGQNFVVDGGRSIGLK